MTKKTSLILLMEVFCLALFLFLPSNLKIKACPPQSDCKEECDPGEHVIGGCTVRKRMGKDFEDVPADCCAPEDYCIPAGEDCDDDAWTIRCCSELCESGICADITGIQIKNPLQAAEFEDILDNLIGFIFNIAVVLAPLMIIIAGFLFVTAAGNLEQINRARAIIIWTAVGFLIILLSRGIMGIIRNILGVS